MSEIADLIAQRRAGKRPKPVLVVHIGAGKTGSSAIQTFLGRNRSRLCEQGIVVPNAALELGRGPGNQVFLFDDLARQADGAALLRSKLRALVAEAASSLARQGGADAPFPVAVVLSAENLSNVGEQHRLFEGLSTDFDIVVLCYVRSQVGLYQTAWQQWHCKRGVRRSKWLQESTNIGDWLGTAERWATIKPLSFDVRVFQHDRLIGGDIVADFCSALQIDQSDLRPNEETVNEALGVHVSRLFEDVPHLFANTHDNRIRDFLRELDIVAARPRSGETLFSDEECDLIRERHRERNRILKERFLPEMGEAELFSDFDAPLRYVDDAEITRRNQAVLFELLLKISMPKEFSVPRTQSASRRLGKFARFIDKMRRIGSGS